MAEKKKWDLASTHSLEAAAEWIRTQSGAEVVFVIRKADLAVGVNPSLLPQEVCGLLRSKRFAADGSVLISPEAEGFLSR